MPLGLLDARCTRSKPRLPSRLVNNGAWVAARGPEAASGDPTRLEDGFDIGTCKQV